MRYVITAAAAVLLFVFAAGVRAAGPECRACVTEPYVWVTGDLQNTEERFGIYRDAGVDMLRIEANWSALERSEGNWDASRQIEYIRLARRYGFRIKLILGVVMVPPAWYVRQHPGCLPADEDGIASPKTLSYCYPGLKALVREKSDRIVSLFKEAGVWDDVDCVIPALGPAGEPIYPHPWTMGAGYDTPRFWNYDANGQAAWRAAMKKKYKTIEKANRAWGTDFESFDSMPLLSSGEKPGAYWEDFLLWYRDLKRDFVRWQIKDALRAARGKRVLVYIPGTAYTPEEWREAVRTGEGGWTVRMMCDSMWVMEEALRQGAELQYTGCQNEEEVARLRNYLDSKGYRDAVMWGENAGYWRCAKDPLRLAEIAVKHRLWGLDYTHAHFAFILEGADRMPDTEDFTPLLKPGIEVKPSPVIMPQLKAAFGIIRDYWRSADRCEAAGRTPRRLTYGRPRRYDAGH
ncbi:MAG: beta-galactosidase [Abditibacteriota bacterium]|nr:beta-galactosidase [Abditibacteriota bacterium]